MIKGFKEVSETEMEIMKFLWSQEEPIATVDLLHYFNNERQKRWKLQTLATFLSRLSKKGLIESTSEGRGTIHKAAISFVEYNSAKAKSILEVMYGGSIKNFFVALYGDKKMSQEEIVELKQWLKEK